MYVDPNRNRNASNLRWLMPYCRPELPRVIGAQTLYLVSAAMALVTPLIAARIVDRVIEQRQLSLLTGLCLYADRCDDRARRRLLRQLNVDGTRRAEHRVPLGERRIREAAHARLRLLQSHAHRRHHEPHDLRHRCDPPSAQLGELPDAQLRRHVRGRARVHDVDRLAPRAGPRLCDAVPVPLHPPVLHEGQAAVPRDPQFACLDELDGGGEHRRQPRGQGVRA